MLPCIHTKWLSPFVNIRDVARKIFQRFLILWVFIDFRCIFMHVLAFITSTDSFRGVEQGIPPVNAPMVNIANCNHNDLLYSDVCISVGRSEQRPIAQSRCVIVSGWTASVATSLNGRFWPLSFLTTSLQLVF